MANTEVPTLPIAQEIARIVSGPRLLRQMLMMHSLDMCVWVDDFQGAAIQSGIYTNTAGTGATALAVVAGTTFGVARLITGTTDNAQSSTALGLHYQARYECSVAVRLQLSAITTVKCEVGFTDALADVGAVNAMGNDGVAPTWTATDAGLWVMDRDTTAALWRGVSVNTDVNGITKLEPTSDQVGPAAATYETLIVSMREYDTSSEIAAIRFYRLNSDGHVTYDSGWTNSATSSRVNLTPWVMVQGRATTSINCDIDFIAAWQRRA